MSRYLRTAFLWVAGLLATAAVAVLVTVTLAIRSVVTPAFVAARASSALGREVSVGAVGLHFKPMLRIRLERVAISPDIFFGTVDVALRVTSLVDLEIEPAIIEVEDAVVALVRHANGGFGLYGAIPTEDVDTKESGELPERTSSSALPTLPKVLLRRVSVAFVDHAVTDPPLRFSFQLRQLELQSVASGERPRLSVAAEVGEGGNRGLLTLDAELGPLEPETSISEQPFRAQLNLKGLIPAPFVPYLPSGLDLRHLEGSLEATVVLEGRATGDLAADLAVSLVDGGVDLAGVRFSAPRFEGRLERMGGEFAVRGARLDAPLVDLAKHRLRNLRASLSVAAGALEVESLDVDSHTGSWRRAGIAGQEGAADLELHVRRTGSIALRGRLCLPGLTGESTSHRAGIELPEIEVHDAQLEIVDRARAGVAPLPLQVSRLRLRDFAEGEIASYSADARVGRDGTRGSLSIRGRLGPIASSNRLAEHPFSLELTATAMDPASLVPFFPERWRPSRAEGLLAARFEAEGPARGGSAEVTLALEDGRLEIAGVEFEGRTALEGRIRRQGSILAVETGRLTSEGFSFAGRRAEDLRASFALANDALEIESLELRAYEGTVHQEGRIVLGEAPSFDLRLEAAGVNASRLFDLAVEGADPTLLEAEAAVRGRWPGRQPNWLESVQGEGRVQLHRGFIPSRDLLTAVSRSLLRLVPGSSGLLRERPQLARLEQLTSTFRVEEERVHTDDLRVRTDDFRVSGRGSVGHELDLDFRLDVALTTRGVHNAFALARTHEQLRDATLLPAVPVQVTGLVRSPTFRADASAFPVATLRGVLGLPGRVGAATRGAVGTARDAAGAVGGGLVGGARRLRDRGEPTERTESPREVLP